MGDGVPGGDAAAPRATNVAPGEIGPDGDGPGPPQHDNLLARYIQDVI